MDDKQVVTCDFEIRLVNRVVTIFKKDPHGFSVPLKKLRTDGPQYNFMNYLLSHAHTSVTRVEVNEYVEGCATNKDLTELVRYCGFDKTLKNYFFPVCTDKRVIFTPDITLADDDMSALLKYMIFDAQKKYRK
jgi:hypothetical protein